MALYVCQRGSLDDQGTKKSTSIGYIYLFSGIIVAGTI